MRSANKYEPTAARIDVLRRRGRQRRLGTQLWTLLHAQALLDDPACRRQPSVMQSSR